MPAITGTINCETATTRFKPPKMINAVKTARTMATTILFTWNAPSNAPAIVFV